MNTSTNTNTQDNVYRAVIMTKSNLRQCAHRAIVRATNSFISGITASTGSVTYLLRDFASSGNTKSQILSFLSYK